MKIKIVLLSLSLLLISPVLFSQVGDWIPNPGYSYFGATGLNQSSLSNYAVLQSKTDGNTFLNSPLQINFRIANSDKMIMTTSGNLGVGTIAPEAKFTLTQVGNGWNDGLRINRDASNYLTLTEDVTDIRLKNWGAGGIRFYTSSLLAATISNNGNVGIGAESPEVKLQVDINSSVTDYSQLPSSLSLRNNSTQEGNLNILSFRDANGWALGGIGIRNKNVGSHTGVLSFWTRNNGANASSQMVLDENGNLGIGTSSPNQKLTVNGTIYGKEIKVDLNVPAPDYVFDEKYVLPSLQSVQSYISAHQHLPEVPSAKELETNGINLSEMNMLLLKKVEELTLYVIDQQKQIEQLKTAINKK